MILMCTLVLDVFIPSRIVLLCSTNRHLFMDLLGWFAFGLQGIGQSPKIVTFMITLGMGIYSYFWEIETTFFKKNDCLYIIFTFSFFAHIHEQNGGSRDLAMDHNDCW